jgi:magnesium transporter
MCNAERFIQPVPQAVLEEESDEPELILEAHLQRGNTLTNALTLVQGQISTTEDFAVRKSDTIRNRLLYINMMISILSLSVTAGSFVGSIFGMNVPNGFEGNPDYDGNNITFRIIVGTTVGGAVVLVVFLFVVLRKLAAM